MRSAGWTLAASLGGDGLFSAWCVPQQLLSHTRRHLGSTLAWLVFAVVYRAQLGGSGVALKLAKGCGHNRYGEPAWPNEIFYVFPVVIAGVSAASMGVASAEPCRGLFGANSFVTPIEIVPEWYFLPSFNVLRLLGDKPVGVGTLVTFLLLAPLAPFMENPVAYQNPFRRFAAVLWIVGCCQNVGIPLAFLVTCKLIARF